MIRNNKRKDAKTEKFSVFIRYPVNTAGSTFPFVFWNISEFDNSVIFWDFQEKSVIFPQKTRQPHEILHEGMYTYYPTILSALLHRWIQT